MITKCEVCGLDKIKEETFNNELLLLCGEIAYYKGSNIVCESCFERIDNTNDEERKKAIIDAEIRAIPNILKSIECQGYKRIRIESGLGLPIGSLLNVDETNIDFILPLLTIIKTYPWIIEVSKAGYDEEFSQIKLVEEGLKIIDKMKKPNK